MIRYNAVMVDIHVLVFENDFCVIMGIVTIVELIYACSFIV
jgi:hypothetical protein